jgi:protocatechuate 3,4-dioxygenase beta subunit
MKLIGRRELVVRAAGVLTLAGLGKGVVSKAIAATTTPIVVTPEETEGPYWVDQQLNRSDLATDPSDNSVQPGFPLVLGVTISQYASSKITPIKGAYVDLWHCNASGIYSDEAVENTTGKKFLRGYQITDAHGSVRFTSIYPGWYSGRTPHIHARVRLYSGSAATTNFTTQFFFDEAITAKVYELAPYSVRPNRDTYNAVDSVYTSTDCLTGAEDGAETLLRLASDSSHAVASFNIVLDLSTTSTCIGGNGGGTPPTGGPGSGGTPPTGTPPSGPPPGAA